jgi:hypothetical protein
MGIKTPSAGLRGAVHGRAPLPNQIPGARTRILRSAQELEASEAWDGIWACASLLHVPWAELPDVFRRVERAHERWFNALLRRGP